MAQSFNQTHSPLKNRFSYGDQVTRQHSQNKLVINLGTNPFMETIQTPKSQLIGDYEEMFIQLDDPESERTEDLRSKIKSGKTSSIPQINYNEKHPSTAPFARKNLKNLLNLREKGGAQACPTTESEFTDQESITDENPNVLHKVTVLNNILTTSKLESFKKSKNKRVMPKFNPSSAPTEIFTQRFESPIISEKNNIIYTSYNDFNTSSNTRQQHYNLESKGNSTQQYPTQVPFYQQNKVDQIQPVKLFQQFQSYKVDNIKNESAYSQTQVNGNQQIQNHSKDQPITNLPQQQQQQNKNIDSHNFNFLSFNYNSLVQQDMTASQNTQNNNQIHNSYVHNLSYLAPQFESIIEQNKLASPINQIPLIINFEESKTKEIPPRSQSTCQRVGRNPAKVLRDLRIQQQQSPLTNTVASQISKQNRKPKSTHLFETQQDKNQISTFHSFHIKQPDSITFSFSQNVVQPAGKNSNWMVNSAIPNNISAVSNCSEELFSQNKLQIKASQIASHQPTILVNPPPSLPISHKQVPSMNQQFQLVIDQNQAKNYNHKNIQNQNLRIGFSQNQGNVGVDASSDTNKKQLLLMQDSRESSQPLTLDTTDKTLSQQTPLKKMKDQNEINNFLSGQSQFFYQNNSSQAVPSLNDQIQKKKDNLNNICLAYNNLLQNYHNSSKNTLMSLPQQLQTNAHSDMNSSEAQNKTAEKLINTIQSSNQQFNSPFNSTYIPCSLNIDTSPLQQKDSEKQFYISASPIQSTRQFSLENSFIKNTQLPSQNPISSPATGTFRQNQNEDPLFYNNLQFKLQETTSKPNSQLQSQVILPIQPTFKDLSIPLSKVKFVQHQVHNDQQNYGEIQENINHFSQQQMNPQKKSPRAVGKLQMRGQTTSSYVSKILK